MRSRGGGLVACRRTIALILRSGRAEGGHDRPLTANCGGDAQGKGVSQARLHDQTAPRVAIAPRGRGNGKAVRSNVASAGSTSRFIYYPESRAGGGLQSPLFNLPSAAPTFEETVPLCTSLGTSLGAACEELHGSHRELPASPLRASGARKGRDGSDDVARSVR